MSSGIATSGGGGDLVSWDVSQTAHGLALSDVLRIDATGDYVKAQANTADTLGGFIVVAVAGVDDFTAGVVGRYTDTAHGLTVGNYYYLSAVEAGELTAIEPTTPNYSNSVAVVKDDDTIVIVPWRPSLVSAVIEDDVADAAGASLAYWLRGSNVVITLSPDIDSAINKASGTGNGDVAQTTASQKPHFIVDGGRPALDGLTASNQLLFASSIPTPIAASGQTLEVFMVMRSTSTGTQAFQEIGTGVLNSGVIWSISGGTITMRVETAAGTKTLTFSYADTVNKHLFRMSVRSNDVRAIVDGVVEDTIVGATSGMNANITDVVMGNDSTKNAGQSLEGPWWEFVVLKDATDTQATAVQQVLADYNGITI